MQYQHTQEAPLYLILVAAGIIAMVGGIQIPEQLVQIVVLGCGALMLGLALCFRQLTVSDEGERLKLCFGPLPLFQRRIRYADITHVERGRTSVLDGWGIHASLSGGWVWNLWGFDCVDVSCTRRRKVRIGTDDVDGLESFLKSRIDRKSL